MQFDEDILELEEREEREAFAVSTTPFTSDSGHCKEKNLKKSKHL